eukprot:2238917-Alexandrium_andersonii.AAC.1
MSASLVGSEMCIRDSSAGAGLALIAETAVGRQSRPGFEALAHRAGSRVVASPGHRQDGRFGGVAVAVRADKYSLVRSEHSSSRGVDR